MKAKLKAWRDRVDALALRERLLVVAAVIGALWWGWNAWLFGPLDGRRQMLSARVPTLQNEIHLLDQQAKTLAVARRRDPDVANRNKLKQLRAATAKVNTALTKLTSRLVPPREMGRLIEAVLDRQQRLSLVRLEGLGAEPLFVYPAGARQPGAPQSAKKVAAPAVAQSALYRHGLRATFKGGYLDILAYLRALEGLPWRFLWDEVSLEVPRYPVARVTLTVYSLSLDDAWIGI